MRNKGKIKSWNEQKGFGFIRPLEGGRDLFLHVTDLSDRSRVPKVGQSVTYATSIDKQGRPCAAKAQLPGDSPPSKQRMKGTTGALFVAAAFLGLLTFLVFTTQLPTLVLWVYLALSVITFLVYGADKTAAKGGAWRTSESTLHWLSLAGGWPGALIAQQSLRHKSRKQSFQTAFWITVAINCVVLIWLCTPSGSQLLQEWGGEVFSNGGSATIEWAD